MTGTGLAAVGLYLGLLLALVKPVGAYMARVYDGRPCGLDRALGWLERLIYRLAGVRAGDGMEWRRYGAAVLLFNVAGLLVLYALLRLQGLLPLNPLGLGGVAPDLALNTAVSFTTNTNWQAYAGETTLTPLTQMLGLTVQNFLSAATGMAVLAAVARGVGRRSVSTLGNFWVDVTRTTLYILLPLAFVVALCLVSQGVVQTFSGPTTVTLLERPAAGEPASVPPVPVPAPRAPVTTRTLVLGPVASQASIKQLGTNGGGFFNVNAAHPFENPTPLSNLIGLVAILLIPAAGCYTFGALAGDTRQGWAILAAMALVFLPVLGVAVSAEQAGNPWLARLGIDDGAGPLQAGGNMEGKEVRFGITASALWATATTAASSGSVNSMHDSYTPLGGLVALGLMQTGEVVFGGVGSGVYGMVLFVVVAVFIAGLMVGRTPEYLGKKLEVFEMKMAAIGILLPPAVVLLGTAAAVLSETALAGRQDPGAHGFSEILYAYSSMGNNNGSAFAGYGANVPFVNLTGSLAMVVARYGVVLPALALAGSLAGRRVVPAGPGTLPTHTPLFVLVLVAVVVVVGVLAFLPALALGPIVEHLLLTAEGS